MRENVYEETGDMYDALYSLAEDEDGVLDVAHEMRFVVVLILVWSTFFPSLISNATQGHCRC